MVYNLIAKSRMANNTFKRNNGVRKIIIYFLKIFY